MKPFDFRKFQTQCDLHRIPVTLGDDAFRSITNGNDTLHTELQHHITSNRFSLPNDINPNITDALWLAAADPDADQSAFLASTAIILMDALNNDAYVQDLEWYWTEYCAHYRSAAPLIRSAIMHAFDLLRNFRLIPDACNPNDADFLTLDLTTVENRLIPIARAITADEMAIVAATDYDVGIKEYTQSLTDLLRSTTLEYPKDGGVWCPREVVNLSSFTPSNVGHIPCTAILLLDAIRNDDRMGNAKSSFEEQWREYAAFPASTRSAFYAAQRYLYETKRHWAPSHPNLDATFNDHRLSIGWPV